jgi:hypothetical protein
LGWGLFYLKILFIISIGGKMGKKRRILRSPKFEHLRQMRKWQTLVEANSGIQPMATNNEPVVETPTLKRAEEELVLKVDPYEMPDVEEKEVPTIKKAPEKKKVIAKKKPARKTRAKKTTSKK